MQMNFSWSTRSVKKLASAAGSFTPVSRRSQGTTAVNSSSQIKLPASSDYVDVEVALVQQSLKQL